MDIYEAICLRRTVRDFEDKEVKIDIIKRILDAGMRAPTNNHMREWEFVIVNDKTSRLKLIDKVERNTSESEIADDLDNWAQDQCQRKMYFDAIPKQYNMLLTSGCLILPFFRQREPLLKPGCLSSLNGFASIWMCIENILLAAVAEGIYGVTRIPFDEEIKHIKEVMKVPSDYEIPCYIALGYPNQNAKQIKQHHIKVEDRIHFNKW
ncbi:Nitroreductase [Natronincola peptidivorans]|uniref:Nitroreductase n=1 Tax=Natronincola peptidivorans TaxID=426128 RepID=A0A1I0CJB9_9FIRM|nr:nitroreductase family protein [Natronincola peptidivorans]SET19258.1 Nitroreductase [Natronincola peptidivorans]